MPHAAEYDQGFVHHEQYDEGETGLTIITIRRTDTCLRIM
jgi:hypothetical protein